MIHDEHNWRGSIALLGPSARRSIDGEEFEFRLALIRLRVWLVLAPVGGF
jgi:hypothetical protein